MIISVKRFDFGDTYTIGHLKVDGQDVGICTLEDTVREVDGMLVEQWKVSNETAIPRGRYRVTLEHSPHFNAIVPHLHDVPGYDHVLIHWGNTDKDTEGCLLLGLIWKGGDFIGKSREAFDKLMALIKDAPELWIEVA